MGKTMESFARSDIARIKYRILSLCCGLYTKGADDFLVTKEDCDSSFRRFAEYASSSNGRKHLRIQKYKRLLRGGRI